MAGLLAIALSSCQKEAQLDNTEPEIQIVAPAAEATYTVGEALPVHISFSENLGLHTYFIWLVAEDGSPTLVDKQHLHALRHEVEMEFPLADIPPGAYELRVEATDHDQNTAVAGVPVAIQ